MIKLQIDLAKINKNKIRVNGKYKNYDIVLVETPNGKYGDWMAKEDRTKQERDDRVSDTILGNAKNIGWGDSGSSSPSTGSKPSTTQSLEDLGF